MSTNTVSRLPSRLPAKSAKSGGSINGTSTEQQQKTLTMPSKLQKGSVKTNLKPPSAGINNGSTILSSTTQLPSPQITTTSNTQIASTAATNVDQTTTKLRPPLKTNIDVMNSKTSPVSSLLPSPKSNISSSSITNNLKSPTKRNLTTKTSKPNPLLKRKNDDIRTQIGRNVRAAHNRKSSIKTPKSISKNISYRKKATTVQQQSRISMKKSTNSNDLNTDNVQLLVEIEKLRAENSKLQAEKKELMQEKGLLTVDVCQMEYRLACEESRVIELEVDVADLRSLLNGQKHNKLDHERTRYQNELDIANNLIMEQATTMSDQQSLIEELMTQLDEQERICQDLQNVIDNFKTKHNILDDLKEILNLPDISSKHDKVQSAIEGIKAN